MFEKVLIANRGAIACRIQRTLRRMGVGSVAVYSAADIASLHVSGADQAIALAGVRAEETYLNVPAILSAAQRSGARAIHPGYGFLSENAEFAAACEANGIVFLGPRPDTMRAFALKHEARRLALKQGLAMLPGSALLADVAAAQVAAAVVGYPVMLKSSAGGGGIGMHVCANDNDLLAAFASVTRTAQNNFGDARVFLERYVDSARHIEVQVFGDGDGEVAILGDRDCSLQRRNQKVVEEAPAPNLPIKVRLQIADAAARLMSVVRYRSAGTVEFLYDAHTEQVYFLEVNTRLQVEHGVTELVTGIDIVEWMVRLGAGEMQPLRSLSITPSGHAMQARIYAEDPGAGFRPSTGLLTRVEFPGDVRVDTWVTAGIEVGSQYDPMLAKILVRANDRAAARQLLCAALSETVIDGVETNRAHVLQTLATPEFVDGTHDTKLLARFAPHFEGCEVLVAGTQSTLQDYPGRIGYWDVGVPPSGPMDDWSFRLGNRLLGNAASAVGMEMTASGVTLRFRSATRVALTGATMHAVLDGAAVPYWKVMVVSAGQTLAIGALKQAGMRSYLSIDGGFTVPEYLGSRATFTLGGFGGHGGRALRVGDVLHFGAARPTSTMSSAAQAADSSTELPEALRPQLSHAWTPRVICGPHGTTDYFTDADLDALFVTSWSVHYQSSRTGVRLLGPKPQWARADGGDAGLHPSNIHDNAYAIGAIDFTGDMPVILGPDGPSLGGFVCPITIVGADLWMLGQMRAGDQVRFAPVAETDAVAVGEARSKQIASSIAQRPTSFRPQREACVLQRLGEGAETITVRASGEQNLLLEFGEPVLDLRQRLRVEAVRHWLLTQARAGILELTPGSRSLQIHFDPRRIRRVAVLDLVASAAAEVGAAANLVVPSRTVHLPLSWDDPATRIAIARYSQSVRADAPWCPSNIEFIRRINGLASEDDVRAIVFNAAYLVLGLGDVYLGAPVATPVDPRHRLVTTKYNPARTWTPENAVGIGGAYMCVYGMEGPGGYQFVGRTLQMWNRFPVRSRSGDFSADRPWLLRFFDQIRFFAVSAEELLDIRSDFPLGRYEIKTREGEFSLPQYEAFLDREADSIAAFRDVQQRAFAAERDRWHTAGVDYAAESVPRAVADEGAAQEGQFVVTSAVAGVMASVTVLEGALLGAGASIGNIESMKMEIPVHTTHAGRIAKMLVGPGDLVAPGQVLAILDDAPLEKTARSAAETR